jgi:hypothetical protein
MSQHYLHDASCVGRVATGPDGSCLEGESCYRVGRFAVGVCIEPLCEIFQYATLGTLDLAARTLGAPPAATGRGWQGRFRYIT